MNTKPKQKIKDSVLDQKGLFFIPLGGSEQFGVNLNVYLSNGRMLAIDCGIGFADEHFPGIDLLLPDPAFLEERLEALDGLIITHAHEDHIGAVAYLWDRLQCPIYTTRFTAKVLREKLREAGVKKARIHEVVPMQGPVEIGPFKASFIPVSHSVPEACAVVLETEHGRVLHSGDWNLDPQPIIGETTNAELFKDIGREGVLAYIGDSTNAEVNGFAGSEADVAKGLESEFLQCEGKIAVTVFSSNIGRVISIARAAKACGRDVCVVGRSLHRMVGIARECGYMDDVPEFVSEKDLGLIPDSRLVLIVTGSQGESRAALAKIARGEHPSVSLKRGDTVIFSARAIPGNERDTSIVKNNLSASHIRIITPRDTENTIHVSGHPCRDEIAQMLQWVRPEIVVPVHGEHIQLNAHAAFARQCQIPHTVVPNNGSVIRLAPGPAEIVDHVQVGLLALDQKRIIASNHRSIAQRRKLQYTGAVHLSVALDAKGKLLGEPKLETMGLIDSEDEDDQEIEDKLYDEVYDLLDEMTWEERTDDHFVSEELRIGLRRLIYHVLGFKPNTTVHVMRV